MSSTPKRDLLERLNARKEAEYVKIDQIEISLKKLVLNTVRSVFLCNSLQFDFINFNPCKEGQGVKRHT